jgi:hypothetical protein
VFEIQTFNNHKAVLYSKYLDDPYFVLCGQKKASHWRKFADADYE